MTITTFYLAIMIIGVMATLLIDLYSILLKHYFNIPSLDYKVVGRWLLYMLKGQFMHASILQSPALKREKAVGWASHYIIGCLFSGIFMLMVGQSWLFNPQVIPALLFGIATVSFPFLIMQPCFGFGVAASKLAKPQFARLKSLSTHALFGVGLYLSAYFLQIFYGK